MKGCEERGLGSSKTDEEGGGREAPSDGWEEGGHDLVTLPQ